MYTTFGRVSQIILIQNGLQKAPTYIEDQLLDKISVRIFDVGVLELIVISVSKRPDHLLLDLLEDVISRKRSTVRVEKNRIRQHGTGCDVVLAWADESAEIMVDRGIVIVKKEADISQLVVPENCRVIFHSNNESMKFVEKKMIPISCGMKNTDTVSFSSKDDGKAVISLQRTLKIGNGEEIEPFEVVVNGYREQETDDYHLLALTATLILLGLLKNETRIDISKIKKYEEFYNYKFDSHGDNSNNKRSKLEKI